MGGGTTGLYILYSLHRMSVYKPLPFSLFSQLSSGNIDRVVDEKSGVGVITSISKSDDVVTGRSSSEIFPVDSPAVLFKLNQFLLQHNGGFVNLIFKSSLDCGIVPII